MHRLFRLSFMLVLISILAYTASFAKPLMQVSGRVVPGEVRVFLKDTTYTINNEYVIQGTLIIEPGTTIQFYGNSRILVPAGGRIIADGLARAQYRANPFSHNGNQIVPKDPVLSTTNPYSYLGYSDMRYFLYGTYNHNLNGVVPVDFDKTVVISTPQDETIHRNSYRYIFDVVVDVNTRTLSDLTTADQGLTYPDPAAPKYRLPFEQAIMFVAARMGNDPTNDYNLQKYPWQRVNGNLVNVDQEQIHFVGQPFNDMSKEWGHIVVLPGARGAFFRNCEFNGLRKDTTVDRVNYYVASDFPTLTSTQLATLNENVKLASNGGGGALTTFSVRTWLLQCVFTCNMARHKGGALQILQAPEGYPRPAAVYPYPPPAEPSFYTRGKNPNLVDRDGIPSRINGAAGIYWGGNYDLVSAIDYIDENWAEPYSNTDRIYWDDARIAVYLGRMRNLQFDNNFVQLANIKSTIIGVPPVQVIRDDDSLPANASQYYGDLAFGGAIYMAGASGTYTRDQGWGYLGTVTGFRTDPFEIGLGVNNSVYTYSTGTVLHNFPSRDTLLCNHNWANNYQNTTLSLGARGGAIYVGKYTSLIFAGQIDNNTATSKFLQNDTTDANSGNFSLGGGIFCENTKGRLQLRGGPNRNGSNIDNPTEFVNNVAGAGGAIYVDEISNYDPPVLPWEQMPSYLISPVIGGSDNYIYTKDYGYNIEFRKNQARSFGGAIYTNRNTIIYGAGGITVTPNTYLGYGGRYPVSFDSNSAGYAGGAMQVRIPEGTDVYPNERTVQIVRTNFRDNYVGKNITLPANKLQVRGGGAIYALNCDLNLMKAVEFRGNTTYNGNGGGIAYINPRITKATDVVNPAKNKMFLTDLDVVSYIPNFTLGAGYPVYTTDMPANYYTSTNGILSNTSFSYTPDSRMLTQFLDNSCIADSLMLATQSGSGTTQIGDGYPLTTANLKGTCWITPSWGYAVGQGGTIIKFTDNADTWANVPSGTTAQLNDIDFLSDKVGFIVGNNGKLLMSIDSGRSWTDKSSSILNMAPYSLGTTNFYSVCFSGSSSNIGYFVGSKGFVAKIVVTGTTAVITRVESGTIHDLFGVYFNRVHSGYAVGHRGVIIKLNELDQWDGQISNIYTDLNSVYFTNDYTGFAVGNDGVMLMTTNAGYSWANVDCGTTKKLNKVFFTGLNVGYVTGNSGLLIKTTDAGATWFALNPNTSVNLNDIFFKIPSTGYVVGNNGFISRTSDAGANWAKKQSKDLQYIDVRRWEQESGLPENGIGLGGAMYILDSAISNRVGRRDSVHFNRARLLNNFAFSGSSIYSDNFDFKLVFNRSLVTSNVVDPRNSIGIYQNAITGPVRRDSSLEVIANVASSDLASTCLYGEVQGPLPSWSYSEAANSIYNNVSRFLIRLPDAPHTKGILAGLSTGIGWGGTDTLRGNYWGRTEANVNLIIYDSCTNCPGKKYRGAIQETFYYDTLDQVGGYNYYQKKYLDYIFWETNAENTLLRNRYRSYLFQGPFETYKYRGIAVNYQPIPLMNKTTVDENTPADSSIPEIVLMAGRIYDAYDKGTDIKTADYAKRRMSPIEDFAVGIPPLLKRFNDNTMPSNGKYVKRYVRDPFIAESLNTQNQLAYPIINDWQTEWQPYVTVNGNPFNYHPIGYPLFLETEVDYSSRGAGQAERSNNEPRMLNESVFFVINENSGDYIRVNLRQVEEVGFNNEKFRARVEFVPDSSNRNENTTIRRSYEGLWNFGTNVGDPHLLRQLFQNPYNEDGATLPGRRYSQRQDSLGWLAEGTLPSALLDSLNWMSGFYRIFSNRDSTGQPSMPASNNKNYGLGNVNMETYFAGERYHALPVRVGDSISVISRTILWRVGVDTAMQKGMGFRIVSSTRPPEYTGDIYHLQFDTIIKFMPSEYPWKSRNHIWDTLKIDNFLNKVFITEDREYPKPVGTYSNPASPNFDPKVGDAYGRDRILNATAKDWNNFYDPRAYTLYRPDEFAYLTYYWEPSYPNSGISRWLKGELIPSGATYAPNPLDEAHGYMLLRGRATNPYVVPAGEEVTVRVYNYPPHYRTLDSLFTLYPSVFNQDLIDKFIYLFTPYLHAPTYDANQNARYLQQDTINVGLNFTQEYRFKLFVVDSNPRFLSPDDPELGYPVPNPNLPEDVTVTLDSKGNNNTETIGSYVASDYPCRRVTDGKLKANLTNKLRFQVDFNTNDELEDKWAEAKNWNFRYGRTAYGFLNTAYRPNVDTADHGKDSLIIIDSLVTNEAIFDGNTVIVQSRPIWMDARYFSKFNSDTSLDDFGGDFTVKGQLNIRIDSLQAAHLLLPTNQYNLAMNLDTIFTVVANDGHGGVAKLDLPLFVNVEPRILPDANWPSADTLPSAMEDTDYNPQLLDSVKMIKIFDANFDQGHKFEILYPDSRPGQDTLWRDPCFPDADPTNFWYIGDKKTAPYWLRINAQSGLLYGMPGVTDAPRYDTVTVVVFDEDGLSKMQTYYIFVDSVNHSPRITSVPKVKCITDRGNYVDTLVIYDKDLKRTGWINGQLVSDTLTIEILNPTGLTATPSTIAGSRTDDTAHIIISAADFSAPREIDGRVTIRIRVVDKHGRADTITYRLKLSEATTMVCQIKVSNNKGAFQELEFGTGNSTNPATTGDGLDGEVRGTLDSNYCEYEIPPTPQEDIFDARWDIPTTNGILRNIFPQPQSSSDPMDKLRIYRCIFNSGGESGNTSNHYPITVTWPMDSIPAKDAGAPKNPTASSWIIRDLFTDGNLFNYNMNTGNGKSVPDIVYSENNRIATIIIGRQAVKGFAIVHDWTSSLGVTETGDYVETKLMSVSPNPSSKYTEIQFGVTKPGKVKIEVLDELGKVVTVVTDADYAAGVQKLTWFNNEQLASGSYTLRMVTGTITSTEKLMIVK